MSVARFSPGRRSITSLMHRPEGQPPCLIGNWRIVQASTKEIMGKAEDTDYLRGVAGRPCSESTASRNPGPVSSSRAASQSQRAW